MARAVFLLLAVAKGHEEAVGVKSLQVLLPDRLAGTQVCDDCGHLVFVQSPRAERAARATLRIIVAPARGGAGMVLVCSSSWCDGGGLSSS